MKFFSVILVAAAALLASAPGASAAPVFSATSLSEPFMSPNGDDVKDFTVIQYTVDVDSADVRVVLTPAGGGSVLDTLQVFTRRGRGTHNLVFDGSTATGALADGAYEVRVAGVGTQGEGSETAVLPLTVDRVAPSIDVLSLINPLSGVVQNGSTITLDACVSGEPDTIYADFSALDSGWDPGAVSAVDNGSCRQFSYTVTAANSLPDASGLRVSVSAQDAAGNLAVRTLPLCLSNSPPSITEVVLLNQSTLFQNGDQIQLEVQFNSPNPISAGVDFTAFDSNFSSAGVLVENLGNQRFRVRYFISEGNTRSDGDYSLVVFGTDPGCGRAEDSSLQITLDNQGFFTSLFTDLSFNTPAFSPNGDGATDTATLTFTVVEDTIRVIVLAENVELRDPESTTTLLISEFREYTRGTHSIVWDGSGVGVPASRLKDQTVSVLIRGTSTPLDRQRSVILPIEVDTTPPQLVGFPTAGGVELVNNRVSDIGVTFDREGYQISADFSALDSGFVPGTPAVADSGGGVYGLFYSPTPGNTVADTVGVPIPLTVTDAAGNTAVTDLLRGCLNNSPPMLVSATLLGAPGPYANSDEIVLETVWSSEPHQSGLKVSADFFLIDDRFNAQSRPATVFDRGGGRFEIRYTISSANGRDEATQVPIVVTATDDPAEGCGATTVDAVFVDLDNVAPATRPTLSAAAPVVRTSSVVLSGTAPDAVLVEIQRSSTAFDSLSVAPDGTFSGAVSLLRGQNDLRGVSVDAAGNRSTPSLPLQVFFAPSNVMLIPARFAPGDEFFLALFNRADRVTVRIFNLEGTEIFRLEGAGSDTFRLPWDGRGRDGLLANSGPCIAVAEIENSDGSRERLRKAFVFTRQGAAP